MIVICDCNAWRHFNSYFFWIFSFVIFYCCIAAVVRFFLFQRSPLQCCSNLASATRHISSFALIASAISPTIILWLQWKYIHGMDKKKKKSEKRSPYENVERKKKLYQCRFCCLVMFNFYAFSILHMNMDRYSVDFIHSVALILDIVFLI